MEEGTSGGITRGETLERDVLGLIADSEGPVGSCALHEQLGALGYRISEPTIGRFLRQLDRRGFTERISNRGRQLTQGGRDRIEELRAAHGRAAAERHLLSTMRPESLDELLDVLVARRAIERETARLAALHATEAEIAELETSLVRQREIWDQGTRATSEDVHFHQLVATASRNRVLAAALDLIRHDPEGRMRLNRLLRGSHLEPGINHGRLVDAIKRRSPDAAEQAIVHHLDDLIERVLRFQRENAETGEAGAEELRAASATG